MTDRPHVQLRPPGDLRALQLYIIELEARQGWDAEGMQTCLLHLGEELGEVYEAARKLQHADPAWMDARRAALGHELVDVLNYVFAIANRAEIDLHEAFIEKNERNQNRVWPPRGSG